jgi:DNA-binding transcriptional LysR family regulator
LPNAKRAADELDTLRGSRRGEISIAAVESLSAAVLPYLFLAMTARYTGVKVTVRTADSNYIPEVVASGAADVGVGLFPVTALNFSSWA